MNAFLEKLTIKQKIRFGFGIIWLALAIITIQAVVNLAMVRSDMAEIVNEKQPFAIETAKKAFLLERSLNALNQYVLTQDERYLESYHLGILEIKAALKKTLAMNGEHQPFDAMYQTIFDGLEQLPPLVNELQSVIQGSHSNFLGISYFEEHLWPAEKAFQQALFKQINNISNQLELEHKTQTSLSDWLALQMHWQQVILDIRTYMMQSSSLSEIEKVVERIESNFNRLESELEKLQQLFPEGLALYQAYREQYMMLQGLYSQGLNQNAIALMLDNIEPLFHDMDGALMALSTQAVQKMNEESAEVLNRSLFNIALLLTLSVLGQLMGMWVSKRVSQSVIEPIQKLSSLMKDISQGEGDLTRRLPVKSQDEMGELAIHFNAFVDKIQAMLLEVTRTVQELEASSGKLLTITSESKTGTQRQLQATNVLSSSMVDMTHQSQQVESHSHNASRATEQAAERVKEGGEAVTGTVKVIQTLSEDMDKMTQSVTQLRSDSDAIGMVVSVIREIAEQTNLLSLNAAIEAARAGEHGRGFAVVADEVRGLAKRTQESTKQIERIIDNIHRATASTVKVVEQGQAITKSSCDTIAKTSDALQPVTILMDDIHQMSEQMAQAAQSQSALAQEINDNINQIHAVTEQTMQGAEKTEQAGHDLQRLANKLDTLVHQFKL